VQDQDWQRTKELSIERQRLLGELDRQSPERPPEITVLVLSASGTKAP